MSDGEGRVSCWRAKSLILVRTMEIPRSSEAFNSRTRVLESEGPKSSLVKARIVEVLPVPGGP